MTKQEIINKLEKASIKSFHNPDGSLNYHRLKKATGLTYYQIKNVFDESKQPTFDTVIKIAECVGKPLKV